MVVNDDPANSYAVSLSAPGYAPSSPVLTYGETSTVPRYLPAQLSVPPYSITVYSLSRR
jgi:hypothetical protein